MSIPRTTVEVRALAQRYLAGEVAAADYFRAIDRHAHWLVERDQAERRPRLAARLRARVTAWATACDPGECDA